MLLHWFLLLVSKKLKITLITLIKYIYRHFLVVVPGNKRLLEKVAFFYMETILCKIIIIYLHTPFYKSFGGLNNETSHAFGTMTISFLSKTCSDLRVSTGTTSSESEKGRRCGNRKKQRSNKKAIYKLRLFVSIRVILYLWE